MQYLYLLTRDILSSLLKMRLKNSDYMLSRNIKVHWISILGVYSYTLFFIFKTKQDFKKLFHLLSRKTTITKNLKTTVTNKRK